MTNRLPAGVFDCASKKGEAVPFVAEEAVEEAEETVKEKTAVRSEFFNLKSGITLTLSSDAVDKEFCDPNSDVSLAGYMNGEFQRRGGEKKRSSHENLMNWCTSRS